MDDTKNKKAFKSIFWGIVNKLIVTLCPFIVRTIMIYTIGAEYLGLNSVFTSILQILSFAELGIGNVMIYSMYKPIADGDDVKICQLLNLYRKIYRIIGVIVLIIGLCLMPFLKYFISGSYPSDINLYVLYGIYLLNSVISYLFFAYRDSLLSAHQKYYITSNLNSVVSLFLYVGEAAALIFFKNYYIYVIFIPLCTLINNLGTFFVTKHFFPQYRPKGKIDKETSTQIRKTVLAGVGHKLGPSATNSIDNLVVSSFLGLTAAAIYSNYNYIVTTVTAFVSLIFSSFVAGIGNSIVTESVDKNFEDFKTFTFFNNWITGFCAICLLCLYQPFMEVWVGENSGLLLGMDSVILFTLMFYVQQIRLIVTSYKSAAGMWYADRFKPYVATILNLILDLIFVNLWGIPGIVLTTIIARACVGIPWETHAMFKLYFKKRETPYYLSLIIYLLVTILIAFLTYFVCGYVNLNNKMATLFVKLGICIVLPNIIYCLIFWKFPPFKKTRDYVKVKLKKVFSRNGSK